MFNSSYFVHVLYWFYGRIYMNYKLVASCMHTHCMLICQVQFFFSKISLSHSTCTQINKVVMVFFFYRFVFEELILSFTTMVAKTFTVEEGWEYMKNNGILKLIRILEGRSEPSFTIAESMMLYTYSFSFFFFWH